MLCAGNPLALLLVNHGLAQINGVRITDSIGILVKMAEMMVDLHRMGINRDKMGIFGPVLKDEIGRTRRIYGPE